MTLDGCLFDNDGELKLKLDRPYEGDRFINWVSGVCLQELGGGGKL